MSVRVDLWKNGHDVFRLEDLRSAIVITFPKGRGGKAQAEALLRTEDTKSVILDHAPDLYLLANENDGLSPGDMAAVVAYLSCYVALVYPPALDLAKKIIEIYIADGSPLPCEFLIAKGD